ncbi:MAG TPA: hypothetical protein V6D48_12200 [Oculatellaceae cyanobacterium]
MGSGPLLPGDKVRIITDLYVNDDTRLDVSVTANSIGSIMSFEEVYDHIRTLYHERTPEIIEGEFSVVAQGIQSGDYLSVRIEQFAPLSETVRDYWAMQGHSGEVRYLAERIVLMHSEVLEKIS